MNYKKLTTGVIVIELIYLVFLFFVPLQNQIQIINTKLFPSSQEEIDSTKAYNNTMLKKIQSIDLPLALLKNEYKGTIIDIQKNLAKNSVYPLIFRLRGNQGSENSFLITQQELPNVVFIRKDNGRDLSFTIDELKNGDSVVINEELDLKKPWPDARKSFMIIVTNSLP